MFTSQVGELINPAVLGDLVTYFFCNIVLGCFGPHLIPNRRVQQNNCRGAWRETPHQFDVLISVAIGLSIFMNHSFPSQIGILSLASIRSNRHKCK